MYMHMHDIMAYMYMYMYVPNFEADFEVGFGGGAPWQYGMRS